MAKLTWTDESGWLEDIFEYIAADSPDAADATVQGIFERAQALAQHPAMGAAPRSPGDGVLAGAEWA